MPISSTTSQVGGLTQSFSGDSMTTSMRASRYFMPILREDPREATIVSHRLMLRAGLVQQIASGIYAWLPQGLRVLRKIESIVRQEQNAAGCVEILAPTLQPASVWHQSGRYDDYGKEMLRLLDRHERELVYGPTAEEVFTEIFRTHVHSYRDVPQRLYNIQWKFRDETRPRFGVMRGREFLMKDAYSFDLTQEAAHASYKAVFESYLRTFARMDLQAIPVRASTGPIGGDLSHEFHVVAETGESQLYYDKALHQGPRATLENFADCYAVADDKYTAQTCPVPPEQLIITRGIEVGHVFYFGTKYSQAMNALVKISSGEEVPVEMGSYGIGVSRLVGALIEAFHDERGIIWPVSVAPFTLSLLVLGDSSEVRAKAEVWYDDLRKRNMDVLYDDRSLSPGEKFAEADLLGYPYQILLSDRTLKTEKVEIKERRTGERTFLSWNEALNWLEEKCQHRTFLL